MSELSFTLYGKPEPQGSTKGFAFRRKNGKMGVAITSDNKKLKPYRHALTELACVEVAALGQNRPLFARAVPVALSVVWTLAKPKSTPKRVTEPTKKPDADKLLRCLLDALTGVAYEDDAQVVAVTARKQYGSPERTKITLQAVRP